MTVLRAVSALFCTFFPLLAQFNGSTPAGEATSTPLNLSLDDAIARGLKTNLGLLTSENSSVSTRVDKMRLLAAMLPTLNATRERYAASSCLQKVHDRHDQKTHMAC